MYAYWVYILASRSRALYIGVTNNLPRRLLAHRSGEVATTAKYRITRLVYAESSTDIDAAIRREKQLKSWRREKKIRLITAANPTWDELIPDWR